MKKPKKKTIWVVKNKIFTTFKAFKTYAWYNMIPGECTNGFEIFEDTVIKEYNLNREERRLICEKTYDKNIEDLKKWNQKQVTPIIC